LPKWKMDRLKVLLGLTKDIFINWSWIDETILCILRLGW